MKIYHDVFLCSHWLKQLSTLFNTRHSYMRKSGRKLGEKYLKPLIHPVTSSLQDSDVFKSVWTYVTQATSACGVSIQISYSCRRPSRQSSVTPEKPVHNISSTAVTMAMLGFLKSAGRVALARNPSPFLCSSLKQAAVPSLFRMMSALASQNDVLFRQVSLLLYVLIRRGRVNFQIWYSFLSN